MAKDKLKVNPSDAYLGGRISKKMVAIAGTLVALVLMVIVTVLAGKGHHDGGSAEEATPDRPAQADNAERDALIASAPASPGIQASSPKPKPKTAATGAAASPASAAGADTDALQDDNLLAQAAQRETLRIRQLKEQQFEVALAAPTMIKVDLNDDQKTRPGTNPGSDPQLPAAMAATGADAPPDPNGQNEKEDFARRAHSNTYLPRGREKPLGQWELKVGTMIPGVLITGLNSDLPGQVIATVSQNIYDSITHSQILLPQGAQMYGMYDPRIAYGQDRALMAWTRINYPDGTTLELDGMGGMDMQGYAGFADQVDHHYWKIFGNAFILGMISGAAQASVSDGKSDNNDNSRGQDISNGVTQQFATTGSTLIQKNLDVQPTITIRNGYKFNIMLNKDIVLPPWQPAD